MKKIIIIFVTLTLFLNSCGTMLSPKRQNIYLKRGEASSSVYVNDALITKTNKEGDLQARIRKDLLFRQITRKEIGYKDEYDVLGPTHRTPWRILSFFPFGLVFYPIILEVGTGSSKNIYNYSKKPVEIPNKTKIITKQENQKYIYLTKSSFDVKKEKFVTQSIPYKTYYKYKLDNKEIKAKKFDIFKEKEDFKVDNSIFTDGMNETLKKNGFIDTTGTILKSQLNTLYIRCTIDDVKLTELEGYTAYAIPTPDDYAYFVDLGLTWEILDTYDQVLYKQTTKVTSGKFAKDFITKQKKGHFIQRCFSDGLEKSFYDLLARDEVQNLLQYQKESNEKNEKMKITAPTSKITSIENAIESNVTVITDEGHGSGFAITEDGYIITNFHVIAGAKEINVQTNQGKKVKAKLVRKNEFADLALLKVEEKFQYAFSVPQDINFTVGSEIFAIGTPKAIEFGQTLTKGIISAKRKKETQEIIQTDASVNSGNSGGALINKNAELVGVVNAKLMGVGVEGIAFAIIAKDIWKYLDLTY